MCPRWVRRRETPSFHPTTEPNARFLRFFSMFTSDKTRQTTLRRTVHQTDRVSHLFHSLNATFRDSQFYIRDPRRASSLSRVPPASLPSLNIFNYQ